MKTYPEEITTQILADNAHISDADIIKDIRDTEYEITQKLAEAQAYAEPARLDRMADFRKSAAESGARDRQAFVVFLKKLLAARNNEQAVEL